MGLVEAGVGAQDRSRSSLASKEWLLGWADGPVIHRWRRQGQVFGVLSLGAGQERFLRGCVELVLMSGWG